MKWNWALWKIFKMSQQKKVLVLGLAKSGEAAARLLARLGAIVTVNDGNPFEKNPAAQQLLSEGIQVICGEHPLELLDESFELMVKNPGIPYSNPMVEKAIAKGIPIWTEVELAYRVSEAPVIAITGSNGKTTTTTMIAEVLNAGGQSALLSGNIGFPASEVAPTAKATDTLVMELSSFQLMGVETFHPHIALITNLEPSHLDYHGDFESYVAAKWHLQDQMTADDYLILNANQPLAKTLASQTKAQVVFTSTQEEVDGAYLLGEDLYFRGEFVMPASAIGVPGSHNVENALATIAVAKLRGVDTALIRETLSAFGGVKHRLQYVGEIAGVSFYNDSKSTNSLATQKALSGFDNRQVILIAGGQDRGNTFEELVDHIRGLKQLLVLGETKDLLKRVAEQAGVPCEEVADVYEATLRAFALASEGDTVLLSPANASWDMYPNFEVRGEAFLTAYEDLLKGAVAHD